MSYQIAYNPTLVPPRAAAIVVFMEDFYRTSDNEAEHEKYVQFFTDDATLIMGSKEAQGSNGKYSLLSIYPSSIDICYRSHHTLYLYLLKQGIQKSSPSATTSGHMSPHAATPRSRSSLANQMRRCCVVALPIGSRLIRVRRFMFLGLQGWFLRLRNRRGWGLRCGFIRFTWYVCIFFGCSFLFLEEGDSW